MSEHGPTTPEAPATPEARAGAHLGLRVGVTAIALLLAAVHLIWPDLGIDAITLGLLLVATLPWLAPIVKQVSFGSVSLELREFRYRIESQLREVRSVSADTKEQVGKLDARVSEVARFIISGSATPQEKDRLTAALTDFAAFMAALGAPTSEQLPEVHVGPLPDAVDHQVYRDDLAYYDAARNLIVVGRWLSDDPDPVRRQYAHHVLWPATPTFTRDVTTQGRTVWRSPLAIEGALANYFPCSFKDDPCWGRETMKKRPDTGGDQDCWINLDNELTVSDINAGSTHLQAADVWAGTLWELRGVIGKEILDRALLHAWAALREDPARNSRAAARFVELLLDDLAGTGSVDEARRVLLRRGLGELVGGGTEHRQARTTPGAR